MADPPSKVLVDRALLVEARHIVEQSTDCPDPATCATDDPCERCRLLARLDEATG